MKGRLLLDVVVGQRASVLELLASEDQPLLVWGDTLLVLELCIIVKITLIFSSESVNTLKSIR